MFSMNFINWERKGN